MKRWNRTVNIKPFITEDDSDAAAQKCATSIKALLVRLIPSYDNGLQLVLDSLEEAKTCDDVNCALDSLYDWADANNVWLGLKS